MMSKGVHRSFEFILNEDTPIINIKGSSLEFSDDVILEGTILKGELKTRIVNFDGEKKPYKFIEITDQNNTFISPQAVNLYISDFVNIDGNKIKEETPVKNTALGEIPKNNKPNNKFIKYGLPIIGAVVGYQVAKKMDVDMKKTIGFVFFFSILGLLPMYINKK